MKMITCPECDGWGRVDDWNKPAPATIRCGTCGGNRKIPAGPSGQPAGGSGPGPRGSGCGLRSLAGAVLFLVALGGAGFAYQVVTGGPITSYVVYEDPAEVAKISGYEVGDCVNQMNLVLISQLPPKLACAEEHEAEVFAQVGIRPGLSDSPPSQEDVDGLVRERCEDLLAAYVGPGFSEVSYEMAMFSTSVSDWPDLAVVCVAFRPPRGELDSGSIAATSE